MQSVNDFFDEYALAIESFNAKSMVFCYQLPCIFISEENSTSFSDAAQLEGFFSKGITFYKQQGITQAKAEVWNKDFWTDSILKVKLIWHYYDKMNNPVYHCDYQYILVKEENRWKITAAVSLNERQQMEAWLASK
jgi:hypothetical protein